MLREREDIFSPDDIRNAFHYRIVWMVMKCVPVIPPWLWHLVMHDFFQGNKKAPPFFYMNEWKNENVRRCHSISKQKKKKGEVFSRLSFAAVH